MAKVVGTNHNHTVISSCKSSTRKNITTTTSRTASAFTSSSTIISKGCTTNSLNSSATFTKGENYDYNNISHFEMEEEHWNDFVFKLAQPEDYSKVLDHMRESFYRDEPLNELTGYSEEKANDMDAMITAYFKDGLSSIVLHKDTNRVVGARIIAIHRRDGLDNLPGLNSVEMNKIMPFLHELDEEAKIFSCYPEVDEYAELFMASVHPEFRGQGLAGEMYRGAIRLLQAKGFKLLKSCFTSPFTQKVGEKMGFRELSRTRFKDYRNHGGELVFPNARDDATATVGVLEI